MKESTDLEILLFQDVAVIDVNRTAGLFYVGKEFVLLLSFRHFFNACFAFLLVLGLSPSVTEKNKLASKNQSENN